MGIGRNFHGLLMNNIGQLHLHHSCSRVLREASNPPKCYPSVVDTCQIGYGTRKAKTHRKLCRLQCFQKDPNQYFPHDTGFGIETSLGIRPRRVCLFRLSEVYRPIKEMLITESCAYSKVCFHRFSKLNYRVISQLFDALKRHSSRFCDRF